MQKTESVRGVSPLLQMRRTWPLRQGLFPSTDVGKRETAAAPGQPVAANNKTESHCVYCGQSSLTMMQCSRRVSKYCSQICQKAHRTSHQSICDAISKLEGTLQPEVCEIETNYLHPKQRIAITNLVGRRCAVECLLDSIQSEALWDTGAQVSVVSSQWVQQYIPHRPAWCRSVGYQSS